MTVEIIRNEDGTTTVITDAGTVKKARRTAVEAAKARLEAAQKRERVALLKKAYRHALELDDLVRAAGGISVRLVSGGGMSDYDVNSIMRDVIEELAK